MGASTGPHPDPTDGLPLVMDGIVRPLADGSGHELVGSYCPRTARYRFPYPDYGSEAGLERVGLGRSGSLHSYSVIQTRAPFGLPTPYAVGYIDLDAVPLRVFCLLQAEDGTALAVGARVELEVLPLGVGLDGERCLRPCFVLVPATGG